MSSFCVFPQSSSVTFQWVSSKGFYFSRQIADLLGISDDNNDDGDDDDDGGDNEDSDHSYTTHGSDSDNADCKSAGFSAR